MDAVCTEPIIYDEQALDSGGQSEKRKNIRSTKKKNTSHNPIKDEKIEVVYLLDGCRRCIRPFTHIPEDIEYCRHHPTGSMRVHLGWQAGQPAQRLPE